MRGLAQSDLSVAARRLIGLPEVAWEQTVQDLLDRAHAAEGTVLSTHIIGEECRAVVIAASPHDGQGRAMRV